jgi:hypothetical protein
MFIHSNKTTSVELSPNELYMLEMALNNKMNGVREHGLKTDLKIT